jgi:hypothetical protein
MGQMPTITYTGAVPGADSNTYNLLNTVTAGWPGNCLPMFGVHKIIIDLHHDKLGTLKWYKSSDSGTNWRQMGQASVAAPAATEGTQVEIVVSGEKHIKIDWVNGGSAQTTFQPDIALSTDRSAA